MYPRWVTHYRYVAPMYVTQRYTVQLTLTPMHRDTHSNARIRWTGSQSEDSRRPCKWTNEKIARAGLALFSLVKLLATIVWEKCARWCCFMFDNLLHKMSFIYYKTPYLQKTIFDIRFMLNLTYFLLNIFLKKMPFWAIDRFLFKYIFLELCCL